MKNTSSSKKNLYIIGAVAGVILAIVVVVIVRVMTGTSSDQNASENGEKSIDTYSETELSDKLGKPDTGESEDQTAGSNANSPEQNEEARNREPAGQDNSTTESETGTSQNEDQSTQNEGSDTASSGNDEQQKNETESNTENNSNQGTSARIVMPKSDEEQQVIDAITSSLAQDLGKSAQNVSVVVDFEEGGYAKGVYGFETEAGGGLFLAQGSGGDWSIRWYGQGSEFCSNTSEYDIPAEMRLECE